MVGRGGSTSGWSVSATAAARWTSRCVTGGITRSGSRWMTPSSSSARHHRQRTGRAAPHGLAHSLSPGGVLSIFGRLSRHSRKPGPTHAPDLACAFDGHAGWASPVPAPQRPSRWGCPLVRTQAACQNRFNAAGTRVPHPGRCRRTLACLGRPPIRRAAARSSGFPGSPP